MFRFKALSLVAPVAAVAVMVLPVQAATVAASGAVKGSVTVTGIPNDPRACANQTFSFDSTNLLGVAVDSAGNHAVINASATAGGSSTICETSVSGAGTVSTVSLSGGCTGTLSGGYVRHGVLVLVGLSGSVTCGSFTASLNALPDDLNVVSLFIPDTTNDVTSGTTTQAAFVGAFAFTGTD
jgi:hypothetical protein